MSIQEVWGTKWVLAFATLVWGGAAWLLPAAEDPAQDRAREDEVRGVYDFEVEDDGGVAKRKSGWIWLYHYAWGHFDRHPLAEVVGGRARVEFSTDRLREKVRPAANVEGYILLLELPQGNYYRSADIEPEQLMTRLLPSLEFMGTVQGWTEDGARRVLLPAARERRVQLESPEGVPLRNRDVPVSIYMTRYNHCAGHQGVSLGTFTTDADGWLSLRAPQVPLYLDIKYYEPDDPGFAGRMFAWTEGVKVHPDVRVVRQIWALPEETYSIRVQDQKGRPLPGVTLYVWQRTHLCGAFDGPLGHADDGGLLEVKMAIQNVERLDLRLSAQAQAIRPLTEAELRQLFQEKKLLLTW